MSKSECKWIEPMLVAFEVENDVKNRRIFRTVSRDICGESMEPSEGSIVLFGKIHDDSIKDGIISVASGKAANFDIFDPKHRNFYHWIDFLFVNKDYQQNGYGSVMLQLIEQKFRDKIKRPVRVESAEKSIGFFQKLGYCQVGEPMKSIYPACHLFRYLQMMEKFSV